VRDARRLNVSVSVIVTPDRIVEVAQPPLPPAGIDWSILTSTDLEAMPVLADLLRS